MKKICSIVGARPQFIKLAVVSRELRKCFREVVIHTGQHYDYNMSEVFFEQLDIPKPDYNLAISGGTHGKMTGEMIIAIEKVLITEQPDLLLLFGDTNSTLAGAIAGVKLNIPIAHMEAGNRLGTLSNPEEANRILTDHVSSIHFACVESAVEFLNKEGKTERVHFVGDPMYDAFLFYSKKNDGSELQNIINFNNQKVEIPQDFYYLTCHRQENTDELKKLTNILSAMNDLECKTIYPVHPRNQKVAVEICEKNRFVNIVLTQPLGYLESISLVNRAKKIVTDSGGLQREAFFAKKQCITILDYVVWPETMNDNCNQLAKPDKQDILNKLAKPVMFDKAYKPFGDGYSAKKTCEKIMEFLND